MSSPLRLVLMRHAKSSWDSGAPDDHSRPLNDRGRRDAPRIADALLERAWAPDFVLSSSAQRTRETWAHMEARLGARPSRFTRALYGADLEELLGELAGTPAEARCVLALGHNPGWEDALTRLSGRDLGMTTANAALLEAPAGLGWGRLPARGWRLVEVLRPKEL